MLLLCISSYLKSVLGHKFLILDTCHQDILYLREQGCGDPWLFFEVKRDPQAKRLGNSEADEEICINFHFLDLSVRPVCIREVLVSYLDSEGDFLGRIRLGFPQLPRVNSVTFF
jgi:hypothetical protein